MMVYDDERETRAEVCEECDHLLRAMPLTCLLVKRQKQIGPMPCPHALRAMLYDAEAVCPHPDEEWANRWRMAEVLPLPEAARAGLARAGSEKSRAGTSSGKSGARTPTPATSQKESANARETPDGTTNAQATADGTMNKHAAAGRAASVASEELETSGSAASVVSEELEAADSPQPSGDGTSSNVNTSVSAEPAGTIVQGDGAIAQGDVINTSATADGSSCAAKTLAREVNIDAIERRASDRLSRRRGVSHRAFYVQGNPTRPLAAP